MIAELDPLYIRLRPVKAANRIVSHLFFEGRQATTRWRWLNLLLRPELSLLARLPFDAPADRPIFILGTGRSGTTILGKLLSFHRDAGLLNEAKLLWHVACPGEDVNGNFDSGAGAYRLEAKDATPPVQLRARHLYRAYLALTGSRRVVDKYPEMVFRVPFAHAIFPDAKFVLLIRNGWDTASSIATWSRRARAETRRGTLDWWGVNRRKWRLLVSQVVPGDPALAEAQSDIAGFDRDEDMAAVEWIASMREGLRQQQLRPEAFHIFRYEDLLTQPKESLGRLLEFCELPPDGPLLDYAAAVVAPPAPKKSFSLHPSITPAFTQAMAALGYPAAGGAEVAR